MSDETAQAKLRERAIQAAEAELQITDDDYRPVLIPASIEAAVDAVLAVVGARLTQYGMRYDWDDEQKTYPVPDEAVARELAAVDEGSHAFQRVIWQGPWVPVEGTATE